MRLMPPHLIILIAATLAMGACRDSPPPSEESATSTQVPADNPSPAATIAPPVNPVQLCSLSGAGGEVVSCPLKLVTPGTPAAGLQFRIDWDPKAMVWVGMKSERCTPNGKCSTVMSPPHTTVGPHGHSLVTSTDTTSQTAGSVTLMIVHSNKPDVNLKADVGDLVFKLRRPIVERDASNVRISGIVATSADAITLPTQVVERGHIRIGD